MVRGFGATLVLWLCAAQHVVCDNGQAYVANGWAQESLQVQNKTVGDCHQACRALLASNHPDLVTYYPDLPADFQGKFFEGHLREKVPICSVEPRAASAVSLVVKAVREHQCPFAIKSGGHGTTSNIANGLLLDLGQMNDTVLSEDKTTASIGPGATWGDVYETLQPHGRFVIGGRVPTVGVGGLLMGGGISGFSPQFGWGFDNIRSYGVVLPDGTISNVSYSSHPDIYYALRGGGSSFGIVTRFQLETQPEPPMWGAMSFNVPNDISEREERLGIQQKSGWTLTSVAIAASDYIQRLYFWFGFGLNTTHLINTMVTLHTTKDLGILPQSYASLSWVPALKTYVAGTLYYCPTDHPDQSPPVLDSTKDLPMLWSAHRADTLVGFVKEQGRYNPASGSRHSWWTSTFKLDAELIREIWDIFIAEVATLKHDVPNALVSSNTQFMWQDQIANGTKNGGNAFGLESADGPLFIFSLTVEYYNAEDDEMVIQGCKNIISKAVELGKQKQLHHPFIYPNYANREQDVFAGFAPKSLKRLKEIQERYDPGKIFSKLQPNSRTFGV